MVSIKPAVCNPSMNFGQQVDSLVFFHFKSAQNKYTLILANQDESSPKKIPGLRKNRTADVQC